MKLFIITAPYLIAATLVIFAVLLGLSRELGAHPFWSTQTALIGTPMGAVLAFATRRANWVKRLIAIFGGLAVVAMIAHYGRLTFAASFAEDRLAGQLWFFGWIAISVLATAFLSALFTPRVSPK